MKQRGEPQGEGYDADATVPARPASESWDATRPIEASPRAPAVLPAADPFVGADKLFAGRFELARKLGQGGMGAVYHARDRQVNGREVALKVLLERYSRDASFRELFFQEIHAAQKFVSEHVVQVRDTGQAPDGTLFLTMDLVGGESLRSLLDREHALNPRHALEIARQVLLGLASGHERGFVHRDVKPSNVMLAARVPKTDENPYGIGVRLLDFGIAGLAAQLDPNTLTGTPKYMSPEQVQAQRLDARSDLFAVGVLLYEMIAGARPFEGETLEEITTSVIETDVAPMIARMEELSPPVRKILQRALQKDREKRFQNAGEFVHAIQRSRAFRIPRVMPVWALGALVLALVAAGVEGKLLYDADQRLEASEARLNGIDGEVARARQDAEAPLRASLARLEQQSSSQSATIEDLRAQLAAAGDTQTLVAAEEYTDESSVAVLSTQVQTVLADMARVQDEMKELKVENETLRRALKDTHDAEQHEAKVAAAFDEIVRLVRNGSGRSARTKFQRLPPGVFDQAAIDGREFVLALVEAAARLQDASEARLAGQLLEAAALDEIAALLDDARRELPEFESQSFAWIGFWLDSQQPADRLEHARGVVDALATRVEELRGAAAEVADSQWEAVRAAGLWQAPAAIVDYGSEHGWQRPAEFVAELAAELERTCSSGPSLALDRLAPLAVLDPWDAQLATAMPGVDPAALSTVRLYATARRVQLGQELPRAFDWNAVPWPETLAARTRDWRAEVRLLDECWRAGPLWPVAHRARAVHFNPRAQGPRWRNSRLAEPRADGWSTQYELYDADGKVLREWREARYARSGRQLRRESPAPAEAWVALTLGEHVLGLEPLPPLAAAMPPKQLWVSEQEHRAFVTEYQASTEPCVVLKGPASTLWFSREYGFVREEPDDPEGQAWVLAYAPR